MFDNKCGSTFLSQAESMNNAALLDRRREAEEQEVLVVLLDGP